MKKYILHPLNILAALPLLSIGIGSCGDPAEPVSEGEKGAATVGFKVRSVDERTVLAEWELPTADVDGFMIVTSSEAGRKDTIHLGRDARSAVITNLVPGDDYVHTFFYKNNRLTIYAGSSALKNAGEGDPPAQVAWLRASSISDRTVRLKWDTPADADPGLTLITVEWKAVGASESGSLELAPATREVDIVEIQPGVMYDFTLRAHRGASASAPATIRYAAAARFTHDRLDPAATLRMYEKTSSHGAGLVLDPHRGGPYNIGVGQPDPKVQLGMYVMTGNGEDSVIVGPAYSFVEFKHVDSFDPNVYISQMSYDVKDLDSWMMERPLNSYIATDYGNVSAFIFPAISTSLSHGFVLRTGLEGEYHYARVLVKNVNGRILQGEAPNRYIEVEVSYQEKANIPFAKGSGERRGGVPARVRR